MTARAVWIVIAGCLAFTFANAEEDVRVEEVGVGESIQPREEGAVWRYRSLQYEDGKVATAGVSYEKVVGVMEIEGVRCFRIEQGWDYRTVVQRLMGLAADEAGVQHYWEYWDGKGSYHFDEEEDDAKPPVALADFFLTLKYPVEKGTRYFADDQSYEVLDTRRKVAVKAGDFTCVVYETIEEDAEDPEFSTRERLFMAPGVGLVRWEMDMRNEGGEWVLDSRDELLSYSLGKKEEKE